jgi:hypothetical protein
MNRPNGFFVAVVGCLALALVLAQVQGGGSQAAPEDPVTYAPITVLEIGTGLKVEGEIVGPATSYFLDKKAAQFKVLVPVRGNFLPEIMRTASSL